MHKTRITISQICNYHSNQHTCKYVQRTIHAYELLGHHLVRVVRPLGIRPVKPCITWLYNITADSARYLVWCLVLLNIGCNTIIYPSVTLLTDELKRRGYQITAHQAGGQRGYWGHEHCRCPQAIHGAYCTAMYKRRACSCLQCTCAANITSHLGVLLGVVESFGCPHLHIIIFLFLATHPHFHCIWSQFRCTSLSDSCKYASIHGKWQTDKYLEIQFLILFACAATTSWNTGMQQILPWESFLV